MNKRRVTPTKFYEAKFIFTQTSVATEIVAARTFAEARQKAAAMEACDINDFDPVDGQFWVESVKPCQEGESHE